MTDERADMSLLRIIRESELRLGEVIGSGAFGTVYSVSQCTNNRLIQSIYLVLQKQHNTV